MIRRRTITAHWLEVRRTRNPLLLLKIVWLVVRQQRTLELLYGGYCHLFHRPSVVLSDSASSPPDMLNAILHRKSDLVHSGTLSRERLLQLYGQSFKVALLPEDFRCSRYESICQDADFLMIGEYGDDARIACLTAERCVINDHYRRVPGVRHIHAIHLYRQPGHYLVSTGDGSKRLDLWAVLNGAPRFMKPIQERLAGYTAAAKVNDEYYFGSDFSGRPNYIGTLRGRKYFFPRKAYKLFVSHFHPYLDRYILAINCELPAADARKTLSVFDTVQQKFIFCDYCSGADPAPLTARHAAPNEVLSRTPVVGWSMMVRLGRLLRRYAVLTGFLTNGYLASTFSDLCPLTGALLS